MADLRKRFGHLVAANRRRAKMTQRQLAEAAELSDDMVARIEVGATGARFPSIERIAAALAVDPAELFIAGGQLHSDMRGPLANLVARLSKLSDADLEWASNLIDTAMQGRR